MEKKKRIEVVIPCYNEEECMTLIYQSIHEVAKSCQSIRCRFCMWMMEVGTLPLQR